MASHATNQPSDNGREQVRNPGKGRNDAKSLTVGVKRDEFPDGAATVLVLDCFEHLHMFYAERVPQECNLLFVRDTQTAKQAMYENPAISVVIVQGMSRKVNNPMIEQIRGKGPDGMPALFTVLEELQRQGEPVNDWLDAYDHTLDFLRFLREQDFGGLVQVVSSMLEGQQQHKLCQLKNLRVQCMDKQGFFQGAFVGKMNKLWERIARFERYEMKVGRKLNPASSAVRHFDELLEKAVFPYPAEDQLFKLWESWDRDYRQPYKVEAIETVLTELEQLKRLIVQGDVRSIYEYAAQLPEDRRMCGCREFEDAPTNEYRWARYLHFTHRDFNKAVWEILDMAGLMEWMRLELEFDLASSETRTFNPEFGRHVRRDYGRQLRGFFHLEGLSEQWVGW